MRYARLFIILMIFGISVSSVNAEDETPSVHETALADKINDARMSKGLEPLIFHPRLYRSASSHSLDMIEKSYYSSTSPDGKTFQERILENGYIPVVSGESLGMLSFRNFINPDDALRVIFDNMLKDESDPERKRPLYLLNPDVRHIAVSFRAGAFEREGVWKNVYIVVCDVGNNDTSRLESELISMINNARKNSRKAFEDLGMDISDVQMSLGYYSWILDNELSPLTNNEKLREAARKHNEDMIERFYFDNISSEGKEPRERIADAGYRAVYINEILLALGDEGFIKPEDAIAVFYKYLIQHELPLSGGRKGIFDAEVTDIGVNIGSIALKMANGKQMKIYIMTIDVATTTGIFSGGDIQVFDKVYIRSPVKNPS